MRIAHAVLLCSGVVACHRPTEVRGIYVSQDGAGTFFPCDDPKSAVIVPDSALVLRYEQTVNAPNEPVYVQLRGLNARSGSIYSGRRYFVVQEILEVRARAPGECPAVAHPVSSVLPS